MGDPGLLLFYGATPGPLHAENCTFRVGPNAIYFTGGTGTPSVDVRPSGLLRRCRCQIPQSWIPDQPFNAAWTVTIDSTGRVATYASGQPWGEPTYSPRNGCYMYELATGITRQVTMGSDVMGPFTQIGLTEAWPTHPAGPLTVSFQIVGADVENNPTVYNSALTDGATATTTGSSAHVTLSAPLPAAVAAEITAGHYLYFYFNNTYWTAAPDDGAYTQPAASNAWGYRPGVSRAQCKRKRILSVAGDRRSLELADTSPYYLPALANFSYTISRFDGLTRRAFIHNKGSWENKTAEGWIHEGNVMDHTGERAYSTNQPGTQFFFPSATFTGNTVTLNIGTWPYGPPYDMHAILGAPYGFGVFVAAPGLLDSEFQNGSWARIFDRPLTSTTGRLQPVDPHAPRTLGDGTYSLALMCENTPWASIKHFIWRYNIFHRGMPPIINGTRSYCLKTFPGGQVAWHDNLQLRTGDRTLNKSYGAFSIFPYLPQGGGPMSPYAAYYGNLAQAVYDDPPIPDTNNLWRIDHNTVARANGTVNADGAILSGLAPTLITPLASHASVSNNIVLDVNGTNMAVTNGTPSSIPNQSTAINATAQSWDPVTVAVNRNVFHGAGSLSGRFAQWDRAQTNSCLTQVASVGLADYANGAVDGFDLANYALVDIYTTGTVTVSSDGTTATLDSGTFPEALVVPGQFFKTTTPAGSLVKIAQVPPAGLGANWNSYSALGYGLFGKGVGYAYSSGTTQRTIQTRVETLPNDQWVQATLAQVGASPSFLLRWSAPGTQTGYMIGKVGGSNLLALFRLDNVLEDWHLLGTPVTWTLADGDVVRAQAVGTVLTFAVNGTVRLSYDTAPDGVKYTSGLVGIHDITTSAHWTTFSCGGPTTATTIASDAFSGGGLTQLVLATPYDAAVRGTGSLPYAITFKGTATDGTDPGADLVTLAAMTVGVDHPDWKYR